MKSSKNENKPKLGEIIRGVIVWGTMIKAIIDWFND